MKVLTQDKSFTQFSNEFQEAYHCISDGALKETLHKHIIPAFSFAKDKSELKILDICFGLGFNTLCFIAYAKAHNFCGNLEIHSPEKNITLLSSLTAHPYPSLLDSKILLSLIQKHYYCENNLSITLHIGDAREILPTLKTKLDIVFQDAFSPKKNPTLWSYEYFKMLFSLTNEDCLLTTYSQNSSMLYTAFLCGFKSFLVRQKEVRDSIILLKSPIYPPSLLESSNILSITPIDMAHKIATNKNLKALYDSPQ